MKLTTDYDRDQHGALFRRPARYPQAGEDKCSSALEALTARIVQGDSPTQIHRWALHNQPPTFLKQLIRSLCPPPYANGTNQFSQSASQIWAHPSDRNAAGQFGQYSFDSMERSSSRAAGATTTSLEMQRRQIATLDGGEHRALFMAIFMATEKGYLTMLQNWGIPLASVRDRRMQGPLHWAVQKQAVGCVQELLQLIMPSEEQIVEKDRHGITPVHLASTHRSGKILKLLLDSLTARMDFHLEALDTDAMTPLHYAAAAASEQCCEMLLGATWHLPVDLRDSQGRTPLHLAAWNRDAANVVRLLMAKKSIAVTARDQQGLTPMHIAMIANNLPVLHALLEKMDGASAQVFDHDSRTPLHYAALYDRAELAHLLVSRAAANNNTRDRFNVTPAHYAAQCATYKTLCAIMGAGERVQNGGGEGVFEGQRQPMDSEGRTPFMWAVIGQNVPVVRQMLSNKADAMRLLTAKDNFKRNCLHLAALSGGLELCKLLTEQGNFLQNAHDNNGATPEHLAAGQGNSELVIFFGFQRGDLQSPLDDMGRTPFFYACLGGQASTVETMACSLHINPAHLDYVGRSALHCAIISGSLNCVKTLMESKLHFDSNILDNDNKTAIDIAREQQLHEIVQYMEEQN